MICRRQAITAISAMAGLAIFVSSADAQECKNRGELDTLYCDNNKDLVADTPTDPSRWKDPNLPSITITLKYICSMSQVVNW